MKSNRLPSWPVWFYLAFLVYGSLVPLDFRDVSLRIAWTSFLNLPWTEKGPFSLTDWTTNVVLYALLGLLGRGALSARERISEAFGVALLWVGCVALSASIEFAQTFTVSRTPLFGDIVANAFGAAVGILLWPLVGRHFAELFAALSKQFGRACPAVRVARLPVALSLLPYLGVLAWMSGWFESDWLTPSEMTDRLPTLHLVPFYQDYFANIAFALRSVLQVTVAFVPMGIVIWAWQRRSVVGRVLLRRSALWGVVTAGVLESGKLFLASKQPDYTNLLFAALGAMLGGMLACRYTIASTSVHPSPAPAPASTPAQVQTRPDIRGRLVGILALAAALVGLWYQPFARIPLAMGALLYVLLLLRHPNAWVVLVPALLPVLDLAPWSGRLFFDAFDLVLLLTVAVGYGYHGGPPQSRFRIPRGLVICLGLYAAIYLVGLAAALFPLAPLDLNSFANDYSPYNPLRVAKGFLWVLVLLPLLVRQFQVGAPVGRLFTLGMTLGLAGEVLAVLWERAVFPGLANVTRDFRVAGLLSSMNVGGSYIEAYLVLAVPFLAAFVTKYRGRMVTLAGMALLLGGLYALAVTFARGGYVAMALGLATLAAGWVMRGRPVARRRSLPYVLLAGLLAGLVVAPIVDGPFSKSRIAHTERDAEVRLAHWKQALEMRDPGWWHELFGMGPGRYPVTYFYKSAPGARPASFSYIDLGGRHALSLGAGTPVYVEQRVEVRHGVKYRLEVEARSSSGMAKLNVLLCERTYFDSFGCTSATFALNGNWLAYHDDLSLNWPSHWGRPVTLSLQNPSSGSVAEIQHIALLDPSGRDVVSNGDFAQGGDRWFFSAFDHLAWHTKNLWVNLLFAQGWLGLAAFALLLGYGLVRITRRFLRQGDPFDLSVLAAVLAFLTVGSVGSLLDAPRMTLLFFMTLLVGILYRDGRDASVIGTPIRKPLADASSVASDDQVERTVHTSENVGRRMWAFWRDLILGVVILATLAFAISHIPGVPYNVRQLVYPASPVLSALALSLFWFWFAGVPVLLARGLARHRGFRWSYPLAAFMHAAVAAWLVMMAVPSRNYHDIVGYPILGWSATGDMESLARLTVLFSAVCLLLTGGAWAARTIVTRRYNAGIWAWAVTALLILPLAHWVVVERAATDNLTELMAGGGGLRSDMALSACVLLIGTIGGLLSRFWVGRGLRGGGTLIWIMLALPLSYGLLQFGTDTSILKYGQRFSALQFLLSADRAHLASGVGFALRYAFAFLGGLLLLAFAQWPFLKLVATRPMQGSPGRSMATGRPPPLPVP